MIIALFIICVIQCLVLCAQIRLIAHNRLDSFGLRVELMTWIMFMILVYSKRDMLQEPIVILFLITICSSRIIAGSSVILGHPHKVSTFSVCEGPPEKR